MYVFITRVGIRRNSMTSAHMWEYDAGVCVQRWCENTTEVYVFTAGVAIRHEYVFSSHVWEFGAAL